MKSLPLTEDMRAVAKNAIWFDEAEKALKDPMRFMAYLMTYGTPADLAVVRRYVGDEDFAAALEEAPAGIMDARSWAYWNVMAGRYPVPPMKRRVFGTADDG